MSKRKLICFGSHNGIDRTKHFKMKIPIKKLIEGYKNTLEEEGGDVHSNVTIPKNLVKSFNKWLKANNFNFQIDGQTPIKILFHPDFQRCYVVGGNEFKEWRLALIDTVANGEPINPISIGFIVDRNGNLTNKVIVVIDGQQRLITICDFVCCWDKVFYDFYYDGEEKLNKSFDDLPEDYKEVIYNYEFDVNICVGTEEAIHRYFKKINQKTFVLNMTELLCSSYCNKFTEDAKHKFCLPSATASRRSPYLNDKSKYCVENYGSDLSLEKEDKSIVRMQSLRKALDWASFCESYELNGAEVAFKQSEEDRLEIYMSNHKKDNDASTLTTMVEKVIDFSLDVWCRGQELTQMKKSGIIKKFDGKVGLDAFYEKYKNVELDDVKKDNISKRAWNLINEPTCHDGWHDMAYIPEWAVIYELEGQEAAEKYAKEKSALRAFSEDTKLKAYKTCNGICPIDGKKYKFEELEYHHIISRFEGGTSSEENCIPMTPDMHKQYHASGGYINGKLYSKNDLYQLKMNLIQKIIKNKLNGQNGY